MSSVNWLCVDCDARCQCCRDCNNRRIIAAPAEEAQPPRARSTAGSTWERRWVCQRCETVGEGFQICGGCGVVRYCGEQCQRAHWKAHKRWCALLGNLVEVLYVLQARDRKARKAEERYEAAQFVPPALSLHLQNELTGYDRKYILAVSKLIYHANECTQQ